MPVHAHPISALARPLALAALICTSTTALGAIALTDASTAAADADSSLNSEASGQPTALIRAAQRAAQTQDYRAQLTQAQAATGFYQSQVLHAHARFLRDQVESCEYQDVAPEACIASLHQQYRASWAISDTPLITPPAMVRVMASEDHCQGAGFTHHSYLQYLPEDTLAKKRINTRLEPMFEAYVDEFTDEGECVANEFSLTQDLLHATAGYLGVREHGWNYFYRAAHPMSFARQLHLDARSGERLEDLQIFNGESLTPLTGACLAKLIEETGIAADDYQSMYGDTVIGVFAQADHWQFTATQARIEFAPYEAAAYAYGFMHCEYPLSALKAYLRPEFYDLLTAR